MGSNTVNLVLPDDTNAEEDEVTITYEIEQTITFEDVPIDIENREADETVEIINNDEIVNTITITGEESIIKGLSIEDFRLRSEEHTSELQSRGHLVCRLLLE